MSSTVVLNLKGATDAATLLSTGEITVNGVKNTLADFGATIKGSVITISGYGKLDATTVGATKLTLTADAPAAKYTLTQGTGDVQLTVVDASAMTNAFTLDTTGTAVANLTSIKTGSGNDVLDVTGAAALTAIEAGDGDNTITVGAGATAVAAIKAGSGSDTITLKEAMAAGTIDLGVGGADTLDVETAQSKAVNVTNYIYSEGDVVKVTGDASVATGEVKLAADGQLIFGASGAGTTTVKAALENNVYKAKVTGVTSTKEKTSEFWTVGTEATSITMDASSMTNDVAMNVAAAKAATVASGLGNDSITVSTAGKTMITLGKASGTDTVNASLTASQTLNLVGGSLENVAIDADTTTTLDYVNTKLATALSDAGGTFNVSFDGGTTAGKLQYIKAGALVAATDTTYFLGVADKTTLQTAAAGANLLDTTKYKGITKVDVLKGGKGTFVGNADGATTINGAAAEASLAIWGGSKSDDSIAAGAQGKAADTIWFGKSDGNDVITGFDAGFGSTADVLKLYDAASLSDVTFTSSGNKNFSVKAGSSQAAITRTDDAVAGAAVQDHVIVELMDGTKKKVAMDLTTAKKINGVGADAVIGAVASAATNEVQYGTTQTDAFTVDLNNTVATRTQYTNINDINATGATGDGTLVGKIGGNSAITAGIGKNNIWGGSTDGNTITLTGTKDTIWFGSTDGKDTVGGFNAAKDTVRLYEASSAADIVKNYVFSAGLGVGNNTTTVALATATDDQVLTLTAAGAVTSTIHNVTAGTASDSTVYKVALAKEGNSISFATDTTIYGGGSHTVAAGNTVTGTVVVDLANAGSYGNYYFDSKVLDFNASGSSATFTIVGRGDKFSTLTGGATKNDIWGGGYACQALNGNDAAVDTFWFGKNDGGDTVSTIDKGDTIKLYDVTSISDVTMTKVDANSYSLSLGTSGLTVTDNNFAALKGGLTFQTMDGSKYTYDTTNSKFVAKA